jgi:hypothetical protein
MATNNLLADGAAVPAAAYAPDAVRRGRARQPPEASLHPRLAALLDRVEEPAEREAVAGAFSGLSRLLDCLAVIKECLDKGAPLEKTLVIFNLINEKAHSLLAFLETKAVGCGDENEPLADALDGTCFAVRHELRRVFDAGILKIGGTLAGSLALADVVRAHGLLNNCFEQSVVALAQLFDARITTVQIFSDYRTKLEQTLSLRDELHRLYALTRRAEEHGELRAYFDLFKALRAFRADQMHNLMYRDWADCEAFVDGITASRHSAELTPLLHQFARYLETLIRHVGMRAVLADQPPDHYRVNDPPATNRRERAGSAA